MVAKFFLLQFYLFGYDFAPHHPALSSKGRGGGGLRQARQKGFRRSSTTAQTFLPAFLVSPENIKFRDERILQPSLSETHLKLKQKNVNPPWKLKIGKWLLGLEIGNWLLENGKWCRKQKSVVRKQKSVGKSEIRNQFSVFSTVF